MIQFFLGLLFILLVWFLIVLISFLLFIIVWGGFDYLDKKSTSIQKDKKINNYKKIISNTLLCETFIL